MSVSAREDVDDGKGEEADLSETEPTEWAFAPSSALPFEALKSPRIFELSSIISDSFCPISPHPQSFFKVDTYVNQRQSLYRY